MFGVSEVVLILANLYDRITVLDFKQTYPLPYLKNYLNSESFPLTDEEKGYVKFKTKRMNRKVRKNKSLRAINKSHHCDLQDLVISQTLNQKGGVKNG